MCTENVPVERADAAACKHILVPGEAHCSVCAEQILHTGMKATPSQQRPATVKAVSALVTDEATWEIINRWLNSQTHRVYNVLGVVQIAAHRLHHLSDSDEQISELVHARGNGKTRS